MLRLDEKEFLILTEKRIKKIDLKIDELKFKVDNSKDFYSKENGDNNMNDEEDFFTRPNNNE